ncbi:DUF4435 domain-containing protein [[Clostridium] fimetarium]|uniref:AAA domain-containing protein, putative AbiEii toxin, Type IV TA system n=1 Tax=[Clostridium] fimetarium TaxID=99656 RepID=A0A1I0QH26_9FIRM|nr:DUF4435 domain-containing protein [[Clostridium] fimetarium]SEW26226.1 AAA domain-containing protein, putative AbiEii toxin, Type IV TA system [[Clostridium] fimetarium]
MNFTYCLPDEQGQKQEYGTTSNSVIIIGANGVGKSKLGAWIEQQSFENVHRIGAQRNLNFNENITLRSYSQAEDLVFYGSNESNQKIGKSVRWDWGASYTTKMMNDFENVLAALIALKNNENETFIAECKKAEDENKEKPQTSKTAIDKLQFIWNEVFPQRKLRIDDSKFYAVLEKDSYEHVYSATQMSDGERSVLYLAAQVLCVPANKTLIMDEPEIHLHRSIMNRLWSTLEQHRPDCLFIYITHDTGFAAMHSDADKIWIREFDGLNWKLEKIENDDLPEDLLLHIIGNRNNVLFVEGEKNSYDTQLYTELYPQYQVIACGSCTQVITRTKAFKNNPVLHHCKVFGIIDRDFRSDYEIEKYKTNNIFTINVAEVENLFLVEELLRLLAIHIGRNPDEVFVEVKNYIIQRFTNQLNGQVCQAVVAEIKYMLMSAEISKKNETESKKSLDTLLESIDYEQIRANQELKFQTVLSGNDYTQVIKVFNEKNIAKTIGHFFGLNDNAFCPTLIALLRGEKHGDIINALAGYLPTEIPR